LMMKVQKWLKHKLNLIWPEQNNVSTSDKLWIMLTYQPILWLQHLRSPTLHGPELRHCTRRRPPLISLPSDLLFRGSSPFLLYNLLLFRGSTLQGSLLCFRGSKLSFLPLLLRLTRTPVLLFLLQALKHPRPHCPASPAPPQRESTPIAPPAGYRRPICVGQAPNRHGFDGSQGFGYTI
jgi:hypothetical protein